MCPDNACNPPPVRFLSIEQWYELAKEGTALPMKIHLAGGSMQPLIRRNKDLVDIVPLYRPLKKGDIVLLHAPDGQYVVHRVFRLSKNTVQTLGDACIRPDPPLLQSDVRGLVVQVQRGARMLNLDTAVSRIVGRVWMEGYRGRTVGFRIYRKLKSGLRRLGARR